MGTLLKYNLDNWIIKQETWTKNLTAKTESMMALGNGYLGLRSVDEEIEKFNKENLFVNGIFNKEHKDEASELANLSDLIQNAIYIDGEILAISKRDYYLKSLNIKNGLLERILKIKRYGKIFELKFTRFVSQANQHVYAQEITIQQIFGTPSEIMFVPMINGQTTNNGAQHFKEGLKNRFSLTSLQYIEETTLSNRMAIHNLIIKLQIGNKILQGGNDDYVLIMNRRQVGFKIKLNTKINTPLILTKLMSVNTSIDDQISLNQKKFVKKRADTLHKYLLNTSFNKELKKSNNEWKKIWSQFFVEIKGKSKDAKYDSLANAFGVFHMNSFVPKNNSNLSVGAKGLSGEGYQGHSFWDTEFFVVLNYLFTNPNVAKNLLVYRYKGIEGARLKAAKKKLRKEESNLKGAQYPWEMAWPTEGEVCPYWGQTNVITGKQTPIASCRQEIHVSADIAYVVHQYFEFTNDYKFMEQMGYEMIFDTAVFWSERAEKQKNGLYEIKDVMGPNEYKGNIDNNAFTNAFAKLNLELALIYRDKLLKTAIGEAIFNKVIKKIPYDVSFLKIEIVKNNLVQQKPNDKGIIAENDQFFQLPRNDVSNFKFLGDAGKKLFNTKDGQKLLTSQLVKQADVVLLTFLLSHQFQKDIIEKNFDFYEPITTHDSSLSPTTYAIQAIELRKMDIAYKLYKYLLNIDMGPNMKSCDKGIHAGALSTIWQTTIFGYGGLKWINGELFLNPILPKQWDGLRYKFIYKGVSVFVSITRKYFTIKTLNKEHIMINIYGTKKRISAKALKVEIK